MNAQPSFGADIRPLFRQSDRDEMAWAFDLWAYEDVREQAEGIHGRLEDGTMPCDEPWPEERIAIFRSWIDLGCAP